MLCVQGKLETDTRHFQNFTLAYLEQIMAAYSAFLFIESKKQVNMLPEHTITEAEKSERIKNGCLKAFSDFKDGLLILDSGNPKYNWLNKNGFIPFSQERKDQILESCVPEVEADLIEERKHNPHKEQSINKILENISCSDFQSRLFSKAKQKALLLFFSELVETDQELSDIIN